MNNCLDDCKWPNLSFFQLLTKCQSMYDVPSVHYLLFKVPCLSNTTKLKIAWFTSTRGVYHLHLFCVRVSSLGGDRPCFFALPDWFAHCLLMLALIFFFYLLRLTYVSFNRIKESVTRSVTRPLYNCQVSIIGHLWALALVQY